jgi:hypothetical protein
MRQLACVATATACIFRVLTSALFLLTSLYMSLTKSAVLIASLLSVAGGMLVPVPAHAFERWRDGHYPGGRAGAWPGRWNYGRHVGRMGWWWVAGPSWYYYDRPYYAPAPQTVIIEQAQPPVTVVQAPAAPTMYYCRATGTYYPDTMSCPGGWTPVVPGAPPAP